MAGPEPPVTLRETRWQDQREALQAVRRRVFIEEQGVPEQEEWDAADACACHVLALDRRSAAPVGTGRLEPTGKIGRVAVLAPHRGAGIGAAIVRRLVNHATELGYEAVYLHAQTTAAGFYRRLGFQAEGPVFEEVGIPHVRMRLGIEPRNGQGSGRHGDEGDPHDAR